MLINREYYLDKLMSYTDKNLIKVITGVRRCGKSFLLQLYRNALLGRGIPEDHIIYLNFEDLEFQAIQDANDLNSYLTQRIVDKRSYYILLDEVHFIKNWERSINSFRLKDKIDLTLTGSNASLLSSELATLLAGRYVQIEMFPLSFVEYLEFSDQRGSDKEIAFNDYMQFGSFPTVVLNESKQLKTDFLRALYDSIIIKDIVTRHKVKDVESLHKVVRFLFDAIGNPLSIQKIVNTIKSAGGESSHEMIGNYLKYLEEAYVFYPVKRFDLKGKEILKTQGKYYGIDTGMRNLIVSPACANFGFVLENLVFLELKRRGYEVYIGKINEMEIDFYCRKLDEIFYIQVAQSLLDEQTRAREFRGLLSVPDNYPKIILSMDRIDFSSQGIKNINLIQFLTSP
jgi:hypothetical protein